MRRVLILVLVSGCILLAVMFVVNLYVSPALLKVAEIEVKNIGQGVLNDAVKRTLTDADYNNLVNVQRDSAGDIQLVTVDPARINTIENSACTYAQQKLGNLGKTGVSVNLGSAVSYLTTGLGPDMKVQVEPRGAASATYFTMFETGGVNQTRHRIYIQMKADLRVLVGLSVEDVEVTNNILVCETIIVGKVPQSYIDVNNKEDMLNLLPQG
jgi:sporulation protein YunB